MSNNLFTIILQTPSGTPNPGEGKGIDFSSPFDLIVFIILPILLIIFYFIWRKKSRGEDD